MELKPGELYFIRERDPLTRETSNYVKIGLVKDNGGRTSDERLDEHQTGNPRDLIIHERITAPAIIQIETTMHGIYAPLRVNGEWFLFNEEQLSNAIDTAKLLATEAQLNLEKLTKSEVLAKEISSDEVLQKSQATEALYERYISLNAVTKEYEQLKNDFDELVSQAIESGEDIGNIATNQLRVQIKFDEKLLQAEHPDIYEQFLVPKERFSGRFTMTKYKMEIDLSIVNPEFYEISQSFKEALAIYGTKEGTNQKLHSLHRELLSMYTRSAWDKELVEAAIKDACGTSKEIEGICKWKREVKTSNYFDKKKFEENHPELFEKYLVAKESTAVIVDRKRQYSDEEEL